MTPNYDPTTNTTTTTASTEKRKHYAWIAAGVVLLALVAVFAFPDGRSGMDPTTGTPPSATDTMPPADAAPTTPPPAAPY